MNFANLNPFVRHAGCYETINNSDECKAYDARLIYVISGDVSVSYEGGKPFHLTAGNLLYIPSATAYRLKGEYLRAVVLNFDLTAERCDIEEKISSVLPTDFVEENAHKCLISPFDKVIRVTDMERERDNFTKMCNIATSREGLWREELSALLKLILIRVAETVNENALPARMVEALDTYIRENCREEISNTEIGAIFGYHPFYVSQVLKEKKGTTLRQYVIGYRLKAAKKLLEHTKRSVAEIAEETGFTDAAYFTKTFRAAFGITPKEYRNKFKNEFI